MNDEVRTHFGIVANSLESVTVDPTREITPERVSNLSHHIQPYIRTAARED